MLMLCAGRARCHISTRCGGLSHTRGFVFAAVARLDRIARLRAVVFVEISCSINLLSPPRIYVKSFHTRDDVRWRHVTTSSLPSDDWPDPTSLAVRTVFGPVAATTAPPAAVRVRTISTPVTLPTLETLGAPLSPFVQRSATAQLMTQGKRRTRGGQRSY